VTDGLTIFKVVISAIHRKPAGVTGTPAKSRHPWHLDMSQQVYDKSKNDMAMK